MITANTTPSYYPAFSPVTPQHIRGPPPPTATALYPPLLSSSNNTASSGGGCSQLQENMADMKIANSHLNGQCCTSLSLSLVYSYCNIDSLYRQY